MNFFLKKNDFVGKRQSKKGKSKNKTVNTSNEKSKKGKGKGKNKAVNTSNEKSENSKGQDKNENVSTSDKNSEDKDKNENVNTSDENSEDKDKDYTTIQIIENIYDEKINRDNFFFKFNHHLNRDVFIGGDCQKAVLELIKELGWLDEFEEIVPDEINKIIEGIE